MLGLQHPSLAAALSCLAAWQLAESPTETSWMRGASPPDQLPDCRGPPHCLSGRKPAAAAPYSTALGTFSPTSCYSNNV